jgi:hypothetical protein
MSAIVLGVKGTWRWGSKKCVPCMPLGKEIETFVDLMKEHEVSFCSACGFATMAIWKGLAVLLAVNMAMCICTAATSARGTGNAAKPNVLILFADVSALAVYIHPTSITHALDQ